jgi:hypothetical protein
MERIEAQFLAKGGEIVARTQLARAQDDPVCDVDDEKASDGLVGGEVG